jgi:hypothetical protein
MHAPPHAISVPRLAFPKKALLTWRNVSNTIWIAQRPAG